MEIKLNSTSNHQNSLKQLTLNGKPSDKYLLKTSLPTKKIRISRKDFTFVYLDPPGGPRIQIGKVIKGTNLLVININYQKQLDKYIIQLKDDN